MDFVATGDLDRLWVFGYGSLIWKPEFKYTQKTFGYIKGYKRRFWQGNTTHRGTKDRVGRVATLVPDKKGVVWGVAYEICGRSAVNNVLNYLNNREMTLGGYSVITTGFQPKDSNLSVQKVIVYMATRANELFMEEQNIDTMALEIHMARGAAGTNSEYVTKLADFVRDHIPEDNDNHLFELALKLRKLELNSKRNVSSQDKDFDDSDS